MRSSAELSLDLNAQELQNGAPQEAFEVEDVCALDALVTNASLATPPLATGESIEIELTAQQMDDLLSGQWQP